jgi:hypothetical protein
MAEDMFNDAIAMLKADHRKVEALFEEFDGATDRRKQAIAQQICMELKIHTILEEELFYPAFEGKIEEDTLDEAQVEHDAAKMLLNEIEQGSPEDDYFDAKVTVVAEEIRHHVHEEEMPGKGMFAQCRKTDVDLVALRDQMMARKEELLAQAKAGGLSPATPKTIGAPAMA